MSKLGDSQLRELSLPAIERHFADAGVVSQFCNRRTVLLPPQIMRNLLLGKAILSLEVFFPSSMTDSENPHVHRRSGNLEEGQRSFATASYLLRTSGFSCGTKTVVEAE